MSINPEKFKYRGKYRIPVNHRVYGVSIVAHIKKQRIQDPMDFDPIFKKLEDGQTVITRYSRSLTRCGLINRLNRPVHTLIRGTGVLTRRFLPRR